MQSRISGQPSESYKKCTNSGVDPGGAPAPNKKYRGESIFANPLNVLAFCGNLHVIRHFCGEFWGLKLHQISNFPGFRYLCNLDPGTSR